MGSYVYTLICAALCTAAVLALAPDKEDGSIGKYISFAGAVVMALTMLSPVSEIFKGDREFDFKISTEAEMSNAENTGKYYAESAGTVLSSLYGVNRAKISAIITEGDDGTLSKITFLIKGSVGFDCDEAEDLLSKIYEIKFEIKGEKDG